MALAYLDLFADAVATYGALLADGGAPGPDDARWTIRRRPTLPEPFSKPLQAAFGSTAYRCAMTWQPRVGRGLLDLVTPSSASPAGSSAIPRSAPRRSPSRARASA